MYNSRIKTLVGCSGIHQLYVGRKSVSAQLNRTNKPLFVGINAGFNAAHAVGSSQGTPVYIFESHAQSLYIYMYVYIYTLNCPLSFAIYVHETKRGCFTGTWRSNQEARPSTEYKTSYRKRYPPPIRRSYDGSYVEMAWCLLCHPQVKWFTIMAI